MSLTKIIPRLTNINSNFRLTTFNSRCRHITLFNSICNCHQPNSSSESIVFHRRYSQNFDSSSSSNSDDVPRSKSRIGGLGKYQIFRDYDSPVILDVDEERQLRLENPEVFKREQVEKIDEFAGMNLERGENGVFEIEELIEILRTENARNIIVIKVPDKMQYTDYMVIVTGASYKHLYSMAEYIRKLFKKKRHPSDVIPRIEGISDQGSQSDWLALDLGNIALHLFLHRVRKQYDLETLWAVGREFDDLSNMKEDQYISLLKEHTYSTTLDDLEPLDANVSENKLG